MYRSTLESHSLLDVNLVQKNSRILMQFDLWRQKLKECGILTHEQQCLGFEKWLIYSCILYVYDEDREIGEKEQGRVSGPGGVASSQSVLPDRAVRQILRYQHCKSMWMMNRLCQWAIVKNLQQTDSLSTWNRWVNIVSNAWQIQESINLQ